MQLSSRISPMWLVVLILGMTGVSCATHKGAVSSSGEPPSIILSQLDTTTSKESIPTKLQVSYSLIPLHFEPNQGQTDEQVHFLSHGHGYTLFLTSTEAVLALQQRSAFSDQLSAAKTSNPRLRRLDSRPNSPDSGPRTPNSELTLRMQLVGANANPQVAGIEELPGKVNYFRGNDPQKWHSDIPTYAKVKYENVYPGVDLAYYGNQRQLEYDFVVTPGADPAAIRLAFDGLVGSFREPPLQIDDNGDLLLHTVGGEIRMHKPQIYQEIDGVKKSIPGGYVLLKPQPSSLVTFQVAAYDTSKPLIIDPVLSYSTYLGGSGLDTGDGITPNPFGDIAVDSSGNAYVVSATSSVDFPTANSFQSSLNGSADVFVTKVNPTGSALIYSTYLGGSDIDIGIDISVDSFGNAYVTGQSYSADFPMINPLQTSNGGAAATFVAKLDPAGSALSYSTYLGRCGSGIGYGGIAVDSSGNAYVTGVGCLDGLPTTPVTFSGSGSSFIVKINPTGSNIFYSGFLGGLAIAIAIDPAGNAYVTGQSPGIQPTPVAFQTTYGGAFVTKINSTGSGLVYSSYLGGGNGDENGYAIAADSNGDAYVTGLTQSSNFPTTPGVFQTTKNAIRTVFVTKVNPTGTAMVYSTYLGGSGQPPGEGDYGIDITVDSTGNAYITGQTTSTDFPTENPFQASFGGGHSNAYITKLNPTGTALIYSSYLGSDGQGFGIALDSSDNAYVTGYTCASDFPIVNPFQATLGGSCDAFVAKIKFSEDSVAASPNQTVTVSTAPDAAGKTGVTATLSNNTDGSDTAIVTVENLPTNPTTANTIDVGGKFVDLKVTGADPTDTAAAKFYYPSTVTGATEDALQLLYFTGTDWALVRSSGGVDPVKNITDNLDSTLSGGRFAVTFDNTSTPQITQLTGTVFTASVKYANGGMCLGAPNHAILQPINSDGTSVFKQGSTVPAKFRVCNSNGVSVGSSGVVSSFKLVQVVAGTVAQTVNESVVSTTPDSVFRWDSSARQWIFNINTKNLQAGKTYFYRITLNDASVIEFHFGLR